VRLRGWGGQGGWLSGWVGRWQQINPQTKYSGANARGGQDEGPSRQAGSSAKPNSRWVVRAN
jgi:hypothetical protein